MAAANQNQRNPTIDDMVNRASKAQGEWSETARKVSSAYLDSYEKLVDRAIELEFTLADATHQEWLRSIVDSQADFARELTHTYTSTARTMLA